MAKPSILLTRHYPPAVMERAARDYACVTRAEDGGLTGAALCRLLADRGVRWLDAQMPAPHLASLGAQQMRRDLYLAHLAKPAPPSCGEWASRCPRWSAADFG